MEKKFFLLQNNYVHAAESSARSIINKIVTNVKQKQSEKKVNEIFPNELTKEVMNNEIGIFDQAFHNEPSSGKIPQDTLNIRKMKENHRPLSAKIMKNPIKIPNAKNKLKRTDTISSRMSRLSRLSRASSIVSSMVSNSTQNDPQHLRRSTGLTSFSTKNTKLFKLPSDDKEKSSLYADEVIQALRSKKKEQQALQKEKENFLTTIQMETMNYQKTQRKFMQQIQNKTYFYDRTGELVQYTNKKSKKIANGRVNLKQWSQKCIELRKSLKSENSYIEYSGKTNKRLSTKYGYEADLTPKPLFYPSMNCNYKIFS